MISVAFDWASRYLALPASSPGLAVDPPEEGGFGIGHNAVMAKNKGDIAFLKMTETHDGEKSMPPYGSIPMREYGPAVPLCAPPSSDPRQSAKITWRRLPLRTLAQIEQDRQAYSLTFAPASLPATQTAISNHH